MEYTGIPLCKQPLLIPGAGFDYGTMLGGYYRPASAEDKQKFEKFPYMNMDKEGLYYWLQNDFISPSEIMNLSNQFKPDYKPLIVTFEVYQKYKLPCGFPKCHGEMTQEEFERNGKCGLQEFMNTPIKINRDGVSPEEYENYKKSTKNVQLSILDWKNKLGAKMEQLRDYGTTIAQNVYNKNVTMQNFMNVAKGTLPALNFIPKECLNTICQSARKAKGENSIKGISNNLKNASESSQLLFKDTMKTFEQSGKAIYEAAGNLWDSTVDSAKQLMNTFNIYQLCPRRFKDWLSDATDKFSLPEPIGLFTQLQNIFSNGILRRLSKTII